MRAKLVAEAKLMPGLMLCTRFGLVSPSSSASGSSTRSWEGMVTNGLEVPDSISAEMGEVVSVIP